jgi:hypothetical protein
MGKTIISKKGREPRGVIEEQGVAVVVDLLANGLLWVWVPPS